METSLEGVFKMQNKNMLKAFRINEDISKKRKTMFKGTELKCVYNEMVFF